MCDIDQLPPAGTVSDGALVPIFDGGAHKSITLAQLRAAINGTPVHVVDENATFLDEATSASGWTITNGSMVQSGSTLLNTKTTAAGLGSSSVLSKIAAYPPAGKDYILYGKVRAKYASDCFSVVWLLVGDYSLSIWLGSANAETASLGSISLRGISSFGMDIKTLATGVNYEAAPVEFAIHFDAKYSTANCYFVDAQGRHIFKGRVACGYFAAPTIQTVTGSMTPAGNWIEHDYLMIARPNLVNIGDSIQEGKTLFSVDPALGLVNHKSTWMEHANLLPGLRNRLVVNKGVGGNTSAQIRARMAEATELGARYVILGASNNDSVNGVSQATRKSNIQNCVNAIVNSGAKAILVNGCYGTSMTSQNSGSVLRNYMTDFWQNYAPSITGVYKRIDTMQALMGANGFADAAKIQSDGQHPNVAGYTAVGQLYQAEMASEA